MRRDISIGTLLVFALLGVHTIGSARPPSPASSAIVPYGEFSNEVVYDSADPHVEGYSLVLFRQGPRFFGTFYATGGLAGDPPNGCIEDVAFDPASRRLSFVARVAPTFTTPPRPGERLAFSGRLALPSRIVGQVVFGDGRPAQAVTLRPRRNGYAHGEAPVSYDDWIASQERLFLHCESAHP